MSETTCRECGTGMICRRWIMRKGKKIFPKHAKAFCFCPHKCKRSPL